MVVNKWLQETSTRPSWGPLKAGEGGKEVNLGLTLNSQPVIVGSLKQPAALGLERGHSWVSRPQWSAEQWGKDVCGLCLQKQRRTDISQNSGPCYYCVLLCAQSRMGWAFRLTKSLGMRTGAGSGNSNTALSWAPKEDNASCPLWTGLASAKIPIFCRERCPCKSF